MMNNNLPHLPFEAEILKARQKWLEEVSRFLQKVRLRIQGVEVCLKYKKIAGFKLDGKNIEPFSQIHGEFYLRLFHYGHIVWNRLPLEPQLWEQAFYDLKNRLPQIQTGTIYKPDSPSALVDAPNTLDSSLIDQLNDTYRLQRIAYALSDNTWHEAERATHTLKKLEGQIYYTLQHRVVGNQSGAIADTHLSLKQHIALNHFHRDEKQVMYAPSSWLPWAMQGATLLRNRLDLNVAKQVEIGMRAVILHPRVVEKILRSRLLQVLSPKNVLLGQQITSPHITLTHELGSNGMILSSAFDDLGQGRASFVMLHRGRLEAPFSIDPLCAEWTVYGIKPQLSNFYILPGQYAKAEMMENVQDGLWVEDAEVEPIQKEFGPNYFSIKLTDAFDHKGSLLAPKKYILSGYLIKPELLGDQNHKHTPALLDQLELSKEVFDTGTALLPFVLSQLELSIYQPLSTTTTSEQAKNQLVSLAQRKNPSQVIQSNQQLQRIKEDSTPIQSLSLPRQENPQINLSTSSTEFKNPNLRNQPVQLPKIPVQLPGQYLSQHPTTDDPLLDIPELDEDVNKKNQLTPMPSRPDQIKNQLNQQLAFIQEKSDLLSLNHHLNKPNHSTHYDKPKGLPPRLPPKLPKNS
jgi:hypothetical protein